MDCESALNARVLRPSRGQAPMSNEITRRSLSLGLTFGLGLFQFAAYAVAAENSAAKDAGPSTRPNVGVLIYDDMILLDLAGPMTVLALAMSDIRLVAKTRNPVRTDVGVAIQPTTTFDECPSDLDVLFVPGGLAGSIAVMNDDPTVAFVSDRGS